MLGVADALVGSHDYPYRQARIALREQGGAEWRVTLFGSDSADALEELAARKVDFVIVNPATAAGPALRGVAPFAAPVPVRAIATIPSYDQLGLAIHRRYQVKRLAEIVERRLPIRLSLRGQRDHSVHMVLDHVLHSAGLSLAQIEDVGARVSYDEGLVQHPLRAGLIARGEADAVFDEGVHNWVELAVEAGLQFISLNEEELTSLEALGYRRAVLEAKRHPVLESDVPALDFSGFLIATHAETEEQLVRRFCQALADRRDVLPWHGGLGLPLRHMVIDAVDAPISVPFHPAAEAFWAATPLG